MMDGIVSREALIEADNGSIAEGQLPAEFALAYNVADDVFTVSPAGGGRISLTTASLVRLGAEAVHLRGDDRHLFKRINNAVVK